MSWADVRCLFCDGRLPLYRKITSGQFCSPAHKKAYWAEQERLAVERLHQTHTSLQAIAATPETIEQILGQPAAPAEPDALPVLLARLPDPAGLIVERFYPRLDQSPEMVSADPVEYETALTPYKPLWSPDARVVGMDCYADAISMRVTDRWLLSPAQPAESRVTPFFPRVPDPLRLAMHAAPQTDEFQRLFEEQIPPVATAQAMPRFEARRIQSSHPLGTPQQIEDQEAPIRKGRAARTKLRAARNAVLQVRLPIEAENGAERLGMPEIAMAARVAILSGTAVASSRRRGGEVEPLELRSVAANAPQFTLSIPNALTNLRLARGRRYPVHAQAGFASVATVESIEFPAAPPEGLAPDAHAYAAATAAREFGHVLSEASKQLFSIVNGPQPGRDPGVPHPVSKVGLLAQPVLLDPIRPTTSRLQPLDEKPISDQVVPHPAALPRIAEPSRKLLQAHVWEQAAHYWKSAPRDLKLLVVAIPVLLGLVLNPALPKVHVTVPATGNVKKALDTQWTNVKQNLADRAAVALNEDFRSGLDDWASRGDATATWSYDTVGFVSPGTLALYRPSMGLADYQFQFLGMIGKKAMSWIVRASDYDNYYVVKLTVLKPGPLPTIGLTRYAVVNGKADSRIDTLVPINAREDTLYRVLMDVSGDNFSVAVQGQMIDSWTEKRLPRGGVGFYSSRGEESRVRWVQVTHQYDMLGRLCAFLAPYDPTTNGR